MKLIEFLLAKIGLLKILLTSVLPQTRPKTDSLQIMSDLFPEDLLGSHFLTVKLGIDTNRHKVTRD